MDALIHVANALFVASYAVRDMLKLRLIAALASTCLLLYFATRAQPSPEVMFWNGLFATLNLGMALFLALQRRRERVSADSTAPDASDVPLSTIPAPG